MLKGRSTPTVVCLLMSLAAHPVSATPLASIVEWCMKGNPAEVVEGRFLSDGWRPITPAEYDTFAGMMADNYLRIVQPKWPPGVENPIGRNWQEMVEKTLQNMDWHLDGKNNFAILTKTDKGTAFAFLDENPTNCAVFSPESMFDKAEVDKLIGNSPKWLTPVGFEQKKVVRDLTGNRRHYMLRASWATSEDLRRAGSALAGANLIFHVGQFEND